MELFIEIFPYSWGLGKPHIKVSRWGGGRFPGAINLYHATVTLLQNDLMVLESDAVPFFGCIKTFL